MQCQPNAFQTEETKGANHSQPLLMLNTGNLKGAETKETCLSIADFGFLTLGRL